MILQSALEAIGNTPHIKINRLFGTKANVYLKLEKQNPGGSIKDRIAKAMIEDAEASGQLKPGGTIIEPTSGNTGIGLALVAAIKGYRLILVMPESMSLERRKIITAYGAEIELTPKEGGMSAAIEKASELASKITDAWIPQQFENQSNVKVHRETTAQEILADFPEGIDYLITGVGTGGHISGIAEVLKPKMPRLKVFAVEPEGSPLIGGGKPGPHKIQGLGANFIPKNLNLSILDGSIPISDASAYEFAKRAAKEEGLLVGISTGAALAAVNQKLPEIGRGATVLAVNYDTGERYLSVEGLF